MIIPKVTVLMSVYNCESYLKDSIISILNQSFEDFEFIIINDCSTDNSLDVILSFSDPRIRLIKNEFNLGLTRSLNKGIELAKGEYIARMDADDICEKIRLEAQVKLMDTNRQVGICGTWFRYSDTGEIFEPPVTFDEIKTGLFITNSIGHPTVMIRKSMLIEHHLLYDITLHYAQDYEMWVRCSRFLQIENIPEILLTYRRHSEQMSAEKKIWMDNEADLARLIQLSFLGLTCGEKEKKLHLDFIHHRVDGFDELVEIINWADRLILVNKKTGYYNFQLFKNTIKYLKKRAVQSFYDKFGYNIKGLMILLKSNITYKTGFSYSDWMAFLLRSLTNLKA